MEHGENIIKQDFLSDSASSIVHTEYAPDALVLMLREELEAKNRQIAELTNVIKTLTESTNRSKITKTQKRKKLVKQTIKSAPINRLINQ